MDLNEAEEKKKKLGIWETRKWNSPREAKNKKSKDCLRDLWDNIKKNNIYIIGVLEGQKAGIGTENLT